MFWRVMFLLLAILVFSVVASSILRVLHFVVHYSFYLLVIGALIYVCFMRGKSEK